MTRSNGFYVCLSAGLLAASCGGSGPAPAQRAKTAVESAGGESGGSGLDSSSGHRRNRRRGARGQSAHGGGEPGKFDFYVLSLSWSPGFCASPAGKNDNLQCGGTREFGFVLHGLWPQYEQQGWPQNCSTEEVDEGLVKSMLSLMPSPKLVRHEWEKHGTCSGLSPKDYFEEAAEAFQAVRIPERYKGPKKRVTIDLARMARDFGEANPKFGAQAFTVMCSGNGRFLQEVRACLTKDLAGRPCNREVQKSACRTSEAIMQPVR